MKSFGPIENRLTRMPKKERLHGKKAVGELFKHGNSFFIYPFKVVFLKHQEADNVALRMLVSVSRRNFKKAVDRNHIKRLVREGWRLNKSVLLEQQTDSGETLDIALIYTGRTILSFEETQGKIILILQRLIKDYASH